VSKKSEFNKMQKALYKWEEKGTLGATQKFTAGVSRIIAGVDTELTPKS